MNFCHFKRCLNILILVLYTIILTSCSHQVPTMILNENGYFILKIPYFEFKTEAARETFQSTKTMMFKGNFESGQAVELNEFNAVKMTQNGYDECKVIKVYDGDTMTLQCKGHTAKTKIRLYCIDAPEMKQKPWGTQARDYLRNLAGIMVKVIEIDKDRYGRIVGEVFRHGINLNLSQVKAGKVAVYDAYCQQAEYKRFEQQAQKAHLGIWAQPGFHQTPWTWRKQKNR